MNINTETNSTHYISSDLAQATAISLFVPIKEIDKTNPRKAIFIFNRNNRLDEIISDYWNKKLRIEPREYFDQLKALKARLYGSE